jgi:hypothetical protein
MRRFKLISIPVILCILLYKFISGIDDQSKDQLLLISSSDLLTNVAENKIDDSKQSKTEINNPNYSFLDEAGTGVDVQTLNDEIVYAEAVVKPELVKRYKWGTDFEKDFFTSSPEFDCCENNRSNKGSAYFEELLAKDHDVSLYLLVDENNQRYDLFALKSDEGEITKIVTYAPPAFSYFLIDETIKIDDLYIYLPVKPFRERLKYLIERFYKRNASMAVKLIEEKELNCKNLILKVFPEKIVQNFNEDELRVPLGVYCLNHHGKTYKLTHALLIVP